MVSRVQEEVRAAIRAIESEEASEAEKAEMLMEIAMGMQAKPKSIDQLKSALTLYEKALAVCPENQPLLYARITARMATCLQAIPSEDTTYLERARDCYEQVREVLVRQGEAEEIAELEMNLGLVLQTLANFHKATIADSISAYQRALRTFNREKFPKEFAILQNNLATAFLSIPFTDKRAKMREALAVQSFEEGLQVVTLIDHPSEYAMLQNNLGNALQYSSSAHAVENNLRAIEAYDEALKVRSFETSPIEYANTISNKANCLLNLPDQPDQPEAGNPNNIDKALLLYREAKQIFSGHGDQQRAAVVSGVIEELEAEQGPVSALQNGAAD